MDDRLLDEFLTESWSLLVRVETGLRSVHGDPRDPRRLGEIRVALRILTGSAGFSGFVRLAGLAHAMGRRVARCIDESLLPPLAALRDAGRTIREVLTALEATRTEPTGNDAALILRLETEPADPLPEMLADAPSDRDERPDHEVVWPRTGHARRVDVATTEDRGETEDPSADAVAAPGPIPLRLHAATVDELLDLVGELDHTRNELLEIVIEEPESRFTLPVSDLDRVTTALETFVLERLHPAAETHEVDAAVERERPRIERTEAAVVTTGSDSPIVDVRRPVRLVNALVDAIVAVDEIVPEVDEARPVQPAAEPVIGSVSPPEPVCHRRSVLVVDDSLLYRQLSLATLERGAFDVVTAECADQAIELIAGGCRFDAIVSDVEMPGTDGFGFARWLRAREEWESAWLVALTSLDASHEPALLAAGFDRYVKKFHARSLLEALSAANGIDAGPRANRTAA